MVHPPVMRIDGLPNLFGVCVYSFMCHHSLPSLGTVDIVVVAVVIAAAAVAVLSYLSTLLLCTGCYCCCI